MCYMFVLFKEKDGKRGRRKRADQKRFVVEKSCFFLIAEGIDCSFGTRIGRSFDLGQIHYVCVLHGVKNVMFKNLKPYLLCGQL